MPYTLKSNSINSAAQIFFVGDNGLSNLIGGSVTTTGTMSSTTVGGKVVYGDAAGIGNYLTATCASAITANQKFAVLMVGHIGLNVSSDRIYCESTAGIGLKLAYTTPGPRVDGYISSWGWSGAAACIFGSYTHPDTGNLRAAIMGRELGGTQKHYADGVGGNAYTGNSYIQAHTATANSTWNFGGSPNSTTTGGFGVALFAVFIGVSPTELADFIAANGTGTTEADKVFSALLTESGGDTTAPTLSSPTAAQTGATTYSGSVSTNEANGTLYYLPSTLASATATAVKAGNSVAVTAIGTKSITGSGLSPSTGYYLHFLHRDAAGNDSAISTSAQFTTASASDTTLPVLTGSITVGTVTTSSIAISWPAGSDNVAVTSYEVSSNAGTSWTDTASTSTSYNFTGLTASTSYTLQVRAKDAAGNISTPALSVTQSTSAPASYSLVLGPLKNNAGGLLANETGATVYVTVPAGNTPVVTKTNVTSNASGIMTISDATLTAATLYRVLIVLSSGAEGLSKVTSS